MSSYSEILRSSSEYSVWLSNLGEKKKYLKVSGKNYKVNWNLEISEDRLKKLYYLNNEVEDSHAKIDL